MSDNLLLLYRAQVVGTYTATATEIELSSVARLVGQLPLNVNLYDKNLGNPADSFDVGKFEVLRVTAVDDITNIATVIREQEGTTGVVIDASNWEVFQAVNPKTITDKVDKVTGKSLVEDTEIAKIHIQNTDTELDQGGANAITANTIKTHVENLTKHREINDAGTSATDLWSASKIDGEKISKPVTVSIDNTDSPYTINGQSIVIVDTTTANVTVNLPDLTSIVGTKEQRPILIYKNDYSQNVIFVETNGAQLVNGKDRDILAGIQQAVIFNPTTDGWIVEAQDGRSIAELAEFFVERENIVNNLTTGGVDKVLSAEQGVVLKDTFDNQFLPIGANPFSDTIIAPTIGFVEKGINPFIYS